MCARLKCVVYVINIHQHAILLHQYKESIWWFGEYVPSFSILFVMRILIDVAHTTNFEILCFCCKKRQPIGL